MSDSNIGGITYALVLRLNFTEKMLEAENPLGGYDSNSGKKQQQLRQDWLVTSVYSQRVGTYNIVDGFVIICEKMIGIQMAPRFLH